MGKVNYPFDVISQEEAERIRQQSNATRRGTLKEALLSGAMVWYPDRKGFGGYYTIARDNGYRLRSTTAERDGVKGTYLWMEKAA